MSYNFTEYKKILSQLSSVTESLIPEKSPMIPNALSELVKGSPQTQMVFSAATEALKSLASDLVLSDGATKYSQIALSQLNMFAFPNTEISKIPFDTFKRICEIPQDMEQFIDIANDSIKSLSEANINQNKNSHIDLPNSLAQFISSVDDSIELPESDSKNIVCVKETSNSTNFWDVISLIINIISIFIAFYFNYSAAISNTQQHSELMQEVRKQTVEEEKQTLELQKQTEQQMQQTQIMEHIQQNISDNLNNNAQNDESSTLSQSQK